MTDLNKKISTATKWSAITEFISKLVAPATSMILARLLTPEAFGIVATVTMVISFTEIFTDAGFQKYLIQKEFSSDDERKNSTNVAFWTNLVMSFLLWGVIIIFRHPIAELVGNPGLGNVFVIACASIPLAAFSSIQIALYKRDFNFKTLFYVRLVGILIPILITIPLAFYLKSYWALIIGTIAVNLSNAIILSVKSSWKPGFYYNFSLLKSMFLFCGWVVLDTILVWSTSYIDIFVIGRKLNEHYLGLYKTSISTVGQIIAIITAIILPVMLPALARLQNDKEALKNLLLKFQKYVGIIIIPLGVGIFLYSDLITHILLGNQWSEASEFIGIWGLMSTITIIFSRFATVVYPAIGKPRYSVIAQVLHLIVLIPAIIISAEYGFRALYWTRSLIRIELILVNLIIVYYLIKLSPWKMMSNIFPEIVTASIMGVVIYFLKKVDDSLAWSVFSIIVSIGVYFGIIMIFPNERKTVITVINQIFNKFRIRSL